LSLGVLVALTKPLWESSRFVPRIAWLSWLNGLPYETDALFAAVLATALVFVVVGVVWPRGLRVSLAMAAFGLGGALLLDQHRLQPWAWQGWLFLTVLALAPNPVGVRGCRAIVVSIYLWSAASKIDPAFAVGHGQMLVDGLLRAIQVDPGRVGEAVRVGLAWSMPLVELVVALGLTVPRARRAACVLAIIMHGGLLLALGPLGLDHEPAVLAWNVSFIGFTLLLFWSREGVATEAATESMHPARRNASTLIAVAITLVAMVAPAMCFLGWFDLWPSWSVYSARATLVRFEVREEVIETRLPPGFIRFVGEPRPLDEWCPVSLEQWSFAEFHAPAYPQARWRLALAAAIAERWHLGDDCRVHVFTRDGWWSTSRSVRTLTGAQDISAALDEFVVTTSPRQSR
jgi:hypothetical protein